MIETEAREATDVGRDAHRILEAHGYPVAKVLGVDRDSILFLNTQEKPRTAWIWRNPETGRERLRVVSGFEPDPPGDWPPDRPPSFDNDVDGA